LVEKGQAKREAAGANTDNQYGSGTTDSYGSGNNDNY
jgi:hypothetical protein